MQYCRFDRWLLRFTTVDRVTLSVSCLFGSYEQVVPNLTSVRGQKNVGVQEKIAASEPRERYKYTLIVAVMMCVYVYICVSLVYVCVHACVCVYLCTYNHMCVTVGNWVRVSVWSKCVLFACTECVCGFVAFSSCAWVRPPFTLAFRMSCKVDSTTRL